MENDANIVCRYLILAERIKKVGLQLRVDSCGFQICESTSPFDIPVNIHMVFFSTHISEALAFCDGIQHQKEMGKPADIRPKNKKR